MKHRYTAVLLACMLLLGGCGSAPSTIEQPQQTPVTETLAETTAESESAGESSETESTGASTEADDTTETAATAATVASAPVQAVSGDPQPVTAAETVDPSRIVEPPAGGADDDQLGELHLTEDTTAAAPVREDKPAATVPENKPAQSASDSKLATKGGAASGKLQVSVQTAEVTLDQLKASDYTVDLLVSLDKNPGITYSEWGLKLDSRCTYTADSKNLPIETIHSISDENHFIWTAWTSGLSVTTETGGILTLHVKLPRDAKSGSAYPVTYADTSLQPAPHIWQTSEDNWVTAKQVGWTNGGVIVK